MLPEFTRGTYPLAFDKAAFLLKKDGDISSVIDMENSFQLIQRVERVTEEYKPLSGVKSEIKDRLIQKKFKTQFYKEAKKALGPYATDESARDIFLQRAGKTSETEMLERSQQKLNRTIFKTEREKFDFYVDT